jgi:branched-chain amino acid transport system permease protein
MSILKQLRRSFFLAIWFVVLTFPIMVIRVNTITDTIEWLWQRAILMAILGFAGSFVWNFLLERQQQRKGRAEASRRRAATGGEQAVSRSLLDRILGRFGWTRDTLRERKVVLPAVIVLLALATIFPFVLSIYQTNIMISALIYVILALGLNIVIGLGNMLHIGFAAFYAIGAYTYGLLHYYFGVGFWIALPIGAAASAIAGILLAIPVLRLRGDYLAIVTLGFGEIVRLVLVNWSNVTLGPSGVKGIARPGFFGMDLSYTQAITYTYFICLALVIFTIFIVNRLENSRIGRQLVAMGEDDVAARAMGVNTTKAKLTAFALGAVWAGLAGVIFAAKTTFINPDSFRVWESVLILCMVVLGGMASIPGVIVGSLILILLPEYLRVFSDYRLLMFGAILVIMMVFRPGGMIPKRRKAYKLRPEEVEPPPAEPSPAAPGGEGGDA